MSRDGRNRADTGPGRDPYRFDPTRWLDRAARYAEEAHRLPPTEPADPAPRTQQESPQPLEAVRTRLRPELFRRFADAGEFAETLRRTTPLFEVTASLISPYLLGLYEHRAGSRRTELEEDAVTSRLTEVVTSLFSATGSAQDGFDPWQGLAEWLLTHLTAWAVDAMEEDLGAERVRSMTVDEINGNIGKYLTERDSDSWRDRYSHLLVLYAQELSRMVVEILDLPNATVDRLEQLAGLRPLEPDAGAKTRGASVYRDTLSPLAPDGYLTVMSAAHYQALREALYKNTFQRVEGVLWPTAYIQKGKALGTAQLRPPQADRETLMPPEEVEMWAKLMWQQREELSDLDADALDALSAIWLYQARTSQDRAVADVDGLLAMRGLKARSKGHGRRSGYEPEQRAEVLRALSHIQNLWINMAEVEVYEEDARGRRRKRTKHLIQSRPFVITDRMGQQRLDGYLDVKKFVFRPGEVFAEFLMGPGRQTALLSAKALGYDPYRQKWEKRLARYLSWQWRAKARHGELVRPYRVATLLEAVGEEVNRRKPSRTMRRLEDALDQLREDGVIAQWQYDRWDYAETDKRGWADVWLQATVLVEPPDVVKDQYQSIERPSPTQARPALPESLGERLKRRRKELGVSQMVAAEDLGISQGYLSQLERGKVEESRLSNQLRKRLRGWLGEGDERAPVSNNGTPEQ